MLTKLVGQQKPEDHKSVVIDGAQDTPGITLGTGRDLEASRHGLARKATTYVGLFESVTRICVKLSQGC
jgi:hypothetical protein